MVMLPYIVGTISYLKKLGWITIQIINHVKNRVQSSTKPDTKRCAPDGESMSNSDAGRVRLGRKAMLGEYVLHWERDDWETLIACHTLWCEDIHFNGRSYWCHMVEKIQREKTFENGRISKELGKYFFIFFLISNYMYKRPALITEKKNCAAIFAL